MSSAFKVRHFISQNEKVRIPDFDCEIPEPAVAVQEEQPLPIEEKVEENSQEEKKITAQVLKADEPDTINIGLSFEEISHVKRYSADTLKQSYEKELKELADSVAKQAYFDALNKKKAELRDCISTVQSLMDELVSDHKQFIEEYTTELKYMAVDIAEKMILEKISEDDMTLARLVMQSAASVKNAEWMNVEVSERLVNLVDYIKRELDKPEYGGKAFAFPVTGTDSICRVTTNDGTVVSSIEVQSENLRKAFREFDEQQ